ncbi:Methyltransferase type 11 [Candidatus Koribacter versatilis Ellin345]|uniref:Methyltransferase type 11 n=1 Tax=Koribacter versatilis (strain Ellin345) TaxID=204669 RepID=Q1ILE8_KORVE|nr:Methyltransferase type 11 [Candidatus Koribacter versatilis Ellin345]
MQAYERRKKDVPVDRYSSFNLLNLTQGFLRDYQIVRILRGAGIGSLANLDILEVGCGSGYFLRQFVQWGADPSRVVGVDLLPERVEAARQNCPIGTKVICCDARQLPFDTASFDVVMQFTALSSVADDGIRKAIADEMMRVVRPGGVVLSYDMCVNNPNNPDIRRVTQEDLQRLFPGEHQRSRRLNLVPPLARKLGGSAPSLIGFLSKIKPICSHLLFVSKRAES